MHRDALSLDDNTVQIRSLTARFDLPDTAMPSFNISHVINVLVRALIPIFGVTFLGWSASKLLVVYLADSLASFYSLAMLCGYGLATRGPKYQKLMKDGVTVGKRLRVGIEVVLYPLPFVLVVGFFLGILPLFVMLDMQQVHWRTFLADRDLEIAVACQFVGAITLLVNDLDWVRTVDDPRRLFQRRVALLGTRWGAIVLFGFFLSPLIALIYGPFLIVTYALATIALELAPARVLDLLARWTGRGNLAVTESVASSLAVRHATPARPAARPGGASAGSLRREDDAQGENHAR